MSNLASMTSQAIEELESSPEIVNLRIVLEEHFDVWTQRLFPLLLARKIGCYRYVTEMLHKDGHTKATEELVATYMRRIREKRKLDSIVRSKHDFKVPRGVTPTVTPTSMAREIQSASMTRLVPSARAVDPIVQAVSPPPVAVPGVEPVEVTDWHAQSRRLSSEGRDAPWNAEDEWMWGFIEKKAKNRNLNIFKNAPDVEEMLDVHQIDCYALLVKKNRRK